MGRAPTPHLSWGNSGHPNSFRVNAGRRTGFIAGILGTVEGLSNTRTCRLQAVCRGALDDVVYDVGRRVIGAAGSVDSKFFFGLELSLFAVAGGKDLAVLVEVVDQAFDGIGDYCIESQQSNRLGTRSEISEPISVMSLRLTVSGGGVPIRRKYRSVRGQVKRA